MTDQKKLSLFLLLSSLAGAAAVPCGGVLFVLCGMFSGWLFCSRENLIK